ncbi:MAG TPA: hypothetical protein PLI07_06765, partial [Candidatus Hydrogenedentes bacterium]|nr:hypothetical protein [Candidatus Hydrogenedentota bacterium]
PQHQRKDQQAHEKVIINHPRPSPSRRHDINPGPEAQIDPDGPLAGPRSCGSAKNFQRHSVLGRFRILESAPLAVDEVDIVDPVDIIPKNHWLLPVHESHSPPVERVACGRPRKGTGRFVFVLVLVHEEKLGCGQCPRHL